MFQSAWLFTFFILSQLIEILTRSHRTNETAGGHKGCVHVVWDHSRQGSERTDVGSVVQRGQEAARGHTETLVKHGGSE